jgi:rhodanese-related sulfurtransferase
MNMKFSLILASAGLMLLPACTWFGEAEKPTFVIANVLDKDAYDDAHIKGSIQVPFEDLDEYAQAHWDKDKTTIVVHCSNYKCTASGAGAKSLTEQGFKKVYAYEAGTAEALKEGLPVVGPAKASYLADYAKPEGYDEEHKNAPYTIVSTENLKKMMQEFAANK